MEITCATGSISAETIRTGARKGSGAVDAGTAGGTAWQTLLSFSALVQIAAFLRVVLVQDVAFRAGALHPSFEVDAVVRTAPVILGTLIDVCTKREKWRDFLTNQRIPIVQTFAGFLIRAEFKPGWAGAKSRSQRVGARVRAAKVVVQLDALIHILASPVVAARTLRNGVAWRAGTMSRSFRVDAGVRAAKVVRQTLVNVCGVKGKPQKSHPTKSFRALNSPRHVLRSSANFQPLGQSQRADPAWIKQDH